MNSLKTRKVVKGEDAKKAFRKAKEMGGPRYSDPLMFGINSFEDHYNRDIVPAKKAKR